MNDLGVLFLIIVLIVLLMINAKYNNHLFFSRKKSSSSSSKTSRLSKNISSKTYKTTIDSKKSRNNKSWFSFDVSDGEETNEYNDEYNEYNRSKNKRNKNNSKSDNYNESNQSNEYNESNESNESNNDSSSSSFRPKLIKVKKNNSINQNKVYDLSIASSKGSSVTCSKDSSESKQSNQGKDYYYLGDPKDSQLYHIFKNVYTFDEANEECIKRNGVLADPQQLANAYTSGANWCNWGWTNDGDAYLTSTSKKCNEVVGLLNGKNIDPYLRLGVNCYGIPKESPNQIKSDDSSDSSDLNDQ
jgi:hypothetical protein